MCKRRSHEWLFVDIRVCRNTPSVNFQFFCNFFTVLPSGHVRNWFFLHLKTLFLSMCRQFFYEMRLLILATHTWCYLLKSLNSIAQIISQSFEHVRTTKWFILGIKACLQLVLLLANRSQKKIHLFGQIWCYVRISQHT